MDTIPIDKLTSSIESQLRAFQTTIGELQKELHRFKQVCDTSAEESKRQNHDRRFAPFPFSPTLAQVQEHICSWWKQIGFPLTFTVCGIDFTWRVFLVNGHQLEETEHIDEMVQETITTTTSSVVDVSSITAVDETGALSRATMFLPARVAFVTFGTGQNSQRCYAKWDMQRERGYRDANGLVGVQGIPPKDFNVDLVSMKLTILGRWMG